MATLAFPFAPSSAGQGLARARIGLTYAFRHQRLPDLDAAPRFTEMVQRRKLFDRDPQQIVLMDKIEAKHLAEAQLGREWITPTLWSARKLPKVQPFASPSMLKARHGCNQYRALRCAPNMLQWRALESLTARWVANPYGGWLDEWAYKHVPRGLLAEPLLGDGDVLPIDYKIYVFGGQATHVQVHVERAKHHRWVLYDRDFRQLVTVKNPPAAPQTLGAMLAAAEQLAAGSEFLRVDFYEIDGKPRFGEFCLYPGSGLDPFAADWIDFELGALWHRARRDGHGSASADKALQHCVI